MSGMMSQRNLLVLLVILVGARFMIVPLLAWQNDQLEIIHSKLRQLSKLELLIGSRSEFADSYQNLSKVFKKAKVDFHSDDDSTKLLIQRQIEDVLSNNDVIMEGFQWVLDESGPVRVLRASIKIRGVKTEL